MKYAVWDKQGTQLAAIEIMISLSNNAKHYPYYCRGILTTVKLVKTKIEKTRISNCQ